LHGQLEEVRPESQRDHVREAEGEPMDRDLDKRDHAGDRDRARRRNVPAPQQRRERREH
jgi:hypothetical protein